MPANENQLREEQSTADTPGTRRLFEHSFPTSPIFGIFLDWSMWGKAEEDQDPCEICALSLPDITWTVPALCLWNLHCRHALDFVLWEKTTTHLDFVKAELTLCLWPDPSLRLSPSFTGGNIWDFDQFFVLYIITVRTGSSLRRKEQPSGFPRFGISQVHNCNAHKFIGTYLLAVCKSLPNQAEMIMPILQW